jgi:hypothetical protein
MKNYSLFVIVSIPCLCFAEPSAVEQPPNVIIFLADDMGLGDTSAYQDWTTESRFIAAFNTGDGTSCKTRCSLYGCTLTIKSMFSDTLCLAHWTLLLENPTETLGFVWGSLSATN